MKHERRGLCAGCAKVYSLNKDGRVRYHQRPDDRRTVCPGANEPPTDRGEAPRA